VKPRSADWLLYWTESRNLDANGYYLGYLNPKPAFFNI
jgi:hypothetical protein